MKLLLFRFCGTKKKNGCSTYLQHPPPPPPQASIYFHTLSLNALLRSLLHHHKNALFFPTLQLYPCRVNFGHPKAHAHKPNTAHALGCVGVRVPSHAAAVESPWRFQSPISSFGSMGHYHRDNGSERKMTCETCSRPRVHTFMCLQWKGGF